MINKINLKEYRLIKGLTQEELAGASGVSIRTIQRIEKGVSVGSPFTLKSLSKALGIDYEKITNFAIDINNNQKDFVDIKLINLSSLSLLIIPFGNLILPLILCFLGKGKAPDLKHYRNKLLSFQIIWSLITLAVMILLPLVLTTIFDSLKGGGIPLFVPVYYLVGSLNILVILQTAIHINEEKEILEFAPNLL